MRRGMTSRTHEAAGRTCRVPSGTLLASNSTIPHPLPLPLLRRLPARRAAGTPEIRFLPAAIGFVIHGWGVRHSLGARVGTWQYSN